MFLTKLRRIDARPNDESPRANPGFANLTRIKRTLMASQRYHMQTQWQVPGNVDDVARVLLDTNGLPDWWPQFHQVEILRRGDQHARGRLVRVVTKGVLPYKLRFQFRMTDVRFPHYFQLRAKGDFDGYGSGTLRQRGPKTTIEFDWRIRVHKPLLKTWSFLFKPLFIHNHRWLMARGQARLERLLRRDFTPSYAKQPC